MCKVDNVYCESVGGYIAVTSIGYLCTIEILSAIKVNREKKKKFPVSTTVVVVVVVVVL